MSNSSSPRPKPTLDDLLRLKRAERPDAAFWDDFERGLRQKQLAAIVEPRPWWLTPSLWVRKAVPYAGFVAAGAAAVFTVMMVRAPGPGGSSASAGQALTMKTLATGSSSGVDATTVAVSGGVISGGIVGTEQGELGQGEETSAAANSAELAQSSGAPRPKADDRAALALVASNAWEQSGADVNLARGFAQAEVGVGLAREVSGTGESVGFASFDLGWEALVAPSAVGNFAKMPFESTGGGLAAPSDKPSGGELVVQAPAVALTRHDRLLMKATEDLAGAEERSLAQVREHVVHRLADGEELYASITRVGVSGDRLSLKF